MRDPEHQIQPGVRPEIERLIGEIGGVLGPTRVELGHRPVVQHRAQVLAQGRLGRLAFHRAVEAVDGFGKLTVLAECNRLGVQLQAGPALQRSGGARRHHLPSAARRSGIPARPTTPSNATRSNNRTPRAGAEE
jgi:hypothetical protein